MREHDIVRRGDVVVACVSGGPDSVALLHLLRELSDEWNLAVHVLHCNHGKRSASEEEETFVVEMCERLGVDVHVRRPEAPWGSSHFQERAREWRRKEARALARDVDARVILQAHHWDDQVETILLKILRGCHLSNIKGMMYVNGDVGRPLLDCRKDELVRYLRARGVDSRVDESNDDATFSRNKIRHELVPLLRELTTQQTNGTDTLDARLKAMTRQSAQLRASLDDRPKCFVGSENVFGAAVNDAEIDVDAWLRLDEMAREDQLREHVEATAGIRLGSAKLEMLSNFLSGGEKRGARERRLGKEHVFVRVGARAWTERRRADAESFDDVVVTRACEGVDITHPRRWTVTASWENGARDEDDGGGGGGGALLSDVPEACAFEIRTRERGDTFRDDREEKLLKDWMRDRKYPSHLRDRTPLVCVGKDVLAVYGVAVGANHARFLPGGGGGGGGGNVLRVVVDRA